MVLNGEVAIVGGGLIGSSTALALADAGADVVLITQSQVGAASAAAAGMLAPSIELASPQTTELATAARDLFPDFVRLLQSRTGARIELNRDGLLEIAANTIHGAELAARADIAGTWLASDEVSAMEPGLVAPHGAALWPLDGAVDSVQLLSAIWTALRSHERVRICEAAAQSIASSEGHAAVSGTGQLRVAAERVVVAAGAWSGNVGGARFAKVVEPVRGQLVEFEQQTLGHVAYGPECYLVPRGGSVIAGSTMEHVGFAPNTTEAGIAMLSAAARVLCPALAGPPSRAWAGLRPVTPDLLPLIGPDPAAPSVIYACGHSRNGVLLAPLTALLLKQLIFEEPLTFDLARFRPDRFAGTFSVT